MSAISREGQKMESLKFEAVLVDHCFGPDWTTGGPAMIIIIFWHNDIYGQQEINRAIYPVEYLLYIFPPHCRRHHSCSRLTLLTEWSNKSACRLGPFEHVGMPMLAFSSNPSCAMIAWRQNRMLHYGVRRTAERQDGFTYDYMGCDGDDIEYIYIYIFYVY